MFLESIRGHILMLWLLSVLQLWLQQEAAENLKKNPHRRRHIVKQDMYCFVKQDMYCLNIFNIHAFLY